jgi:hypothetical protein
MQKHQGEREELKSWQEIRKDRLWEAKRKEGKQEHTVHKLLSVIIEACRVSCLK